MLFVNRDINGSPLPDGFAAALWNEAAKPIVRLYFDFSGTGVDVEIPPEDVISFSISDKVEGTNGRACANTVSLELHNYYHRYSSHVGNPDYDPTIYAYNGPLQADGRGNLRPKRRFRIHVSLPEFPGVTVRIFEGVVGTRGFSESIGAGNENTVKVEINDYAKLLLDKEPSGAKVQYGSQWTEREFCLRDLTISNPNAPTQSLIHQIVAVLDPTFAKIKISAQNIPISIPYAPLEDNLWSEIATLADAVHGIAVFTGETLYFGDSRFFGVEESDIVIDNSRFSNLSHYDNTADIKNKLSLSYSQYKKLPMCALWMYPGSDKFGNIPNGGKLFDLTNPQDIPELFDPNVVFKAKYAVNVNTPTVMAGFLAGTPGITVTQDVADNYEVMAADNLGYKMNLSPNITALTRFDITTLRSSAIIHMDKGALTKPILKNLVIYGEPVVKTDENRSFAENASSIAQYGELSEEYDNKYITRDVIATSSGSKTHDKAWLDIAMARSSVPRRTYEFSCSMPLLLARSGTIVTIRESLQGSGVNVKARLDQVSVKYNGTTARWTTSFLAKEEALLTPVYEYQGQVTPNNGGYAPEPRHIDASEGGVLVPYSVGDTLTYTDGMLYRAVSPKAINEEFSIADFVLVTPSNQGQVVLLSKMLSVPISSITRSRAGVLTPSSIPISALNSDGTPYSGRFKVAISPDNGTNWIDQYVSVADESSTEYEVPARAIPDCGLALSSDGTYSTKAPDVSGNGNDATIFGATPVDGGFSFDGVNDYLEAPIAYDGGIVTISAEVDFSSDYCIGFDNMANTWCIGFRKYAPTTPEVVWGIKKSGTDYSYCRVATPSSGRGVISFVFRNDGTGPEIYVAGVKKTGTIVSGGTGGLSGMTSTAYKFQVGRGSILEAAKYKAGFTSYPRIYNRALTAEEIAYISVHPEVHPMAYTSGVRASLYAAGGTTTLLRETTVPVALDSSSSAIYWGAYDTMAAWPSAGMIESDFLLDGRAPVESGAAEGGVMRRWDGGGWVEYLPSDPGYGDAWAKVRLDLMVWANAKGITTIAAVNAVFGAVAANRAFISVLEAQELKVKGTIKTGDGASDDARVAVIDSVGVISKTFDGTGTDDLSVAQEGVTAGTVVVEITEAQVGDTGPSGGKIVSLAPNIEASPSDLADMGWDEAVSAAAAATIGGKDDWALPTRAQLQTIRTQIGSTMRQGLYWTSEAVGNDAYAVDMATGAEELLAKSRGAVGSAPISSYGFYAGGLYEGKLYLLNKSTASLVIYDLETETETIRSLLFSGAWYYAVIINGKLISMRNTTELLVYDIEADTETYKTTPVSITSRGYIAFEDKVYILPSSSLDCVVYDVANDTFSVITFAVSMARRTGHIYNGLLYSPEDMATTQGRLEIYNLATGVSVIKTLSSIQRRLTSILYGGKIYMPSFEGNDMMEVYDIAGDTLVIKTLPSSMARACSVLSCGKIYMPDYNGNRLEIYDIASGPAALKTLLNTARRYLCFNYREVLYMPSALSASMDTYSIPFPARPIRTNTETKRWTHALDGGAPVAHGPIVAGAIYDTAIDIKMSWPAIAGHIVGDTWTLVQDSMIALSVRDPDGVEYLRAADGVVECLIDEGGVPTMARVGAGIIESGSNSNGSWIKYGDGTMECWGKFVSSTTGLVVSAYLHTIAHGVNTRNLPVSFIDVLYSTQMQVHISTNSNLIGCIGVEATTVNSISWREQWPFDYSGSNRTYEWKCTGRWKA